MYLLFLHQLVFDTESTKRGSFLTCFTEVLMQIIYGYYVEQDECCVINMRKLKVTAAETSHIATYAIWKFSMLFELNPGLHCTYTVRKSWAYIWFILNKNMYARRIALLAYKLPVG